METKIASGSTPRNELINVAVFAAIWGFSEIVLGTILNSARIPFRSIIMAFIAAVVLISAKPFNPLKGSLILIGAVTATLKLFISAGFNVTPFIAILIESCIAEAVFAIGSYNRISSSIVGLIILIYTLLHALIMQSFFLGVEIYSVYYKMALKFAEELGLTKTFINYIVISIPITYILTGLLAGFTGWRLGNKIKEHRECRNEN